MAMNIHWTLEVSVPQLDVLTQTLREIGEKLVAEIAGIQDAINRLIENQANGQAAMSSHLLAIEEEIRQLGTTPTQEQLDHLAAQVHAAADRSAQAETDLRAMTEQVKGMVPDTPPAG